MLPTYFSEVWWMKKQNMKEKFWVAAVVMLLILIVFAGCNKKSSQIPDGDGKPLKDFMGDFSFVCASLDWDDLWIGLG